MNPLRIALILAATVVLSLLLAPHALAQEAVSLHFAPEVGQELRYTIQSRESFKTTMADRPTLRRGAEHTYGVVIKPIRLDEGGGGAAELTIVSYSFAVTSAAGTRHGFDSANPKANPLTASFETELLPVLGRAVTLEFDVSGEIIDIQGLAPLRHTGLWNRLDRELFSDDALRRKIAPIFGVGKLSPQTKPGETWRTHDIVSATPDFALSITGQHSLNSVKDGLATVFDVSTLDVPPVAPDARVIATFDSGGGSGMTVWNLQTRTLRSYNASNRVIVAVTVDEEQRLIEDELVESIVYTPQ